MKLESETHLLYIWTYCYASKVQISNVLPSKPWIQCKKATLSHNWRCGWQGWALQPISIDPIDSGGDFRGAEDEPITIIGYLDDLEEEPLPDLGSENSDQEDSGLDLELDNEVEEISEVSALEKFANIDIGLSGAEAAWANKKYYGHRTLPLIMLAEVQRAQINMAAPL